MNALIAAILLVLMQSGYTAPSFAGEPNRYNETTIRVSPLSRDYVCVYWADGLPTFDVGSDPNCNTANPRLHKLFNCDAWGEIYAGCFGA